MAWWIPRVRTHKDVSLVPRGGVAIVAIEGVHVHEGGFRGLPRTVPCPPLIDGSRPVGGDGDRPTTPRAISRDGREGKVWGALEWKKMSA